MSGIQDRRPGAERFGAPLDHELARREQLADSYDRDYGQERVFPRLLLELFDEVPEGVDLLEVGAATGLLTRRLLERAGRVTALDPSQGMLQRLLERAQADPDRLVIHQGMVEDLPRGKHYDMAVVTFTP
ncbi:MAG: class I SAM-dependent methyltransferase, partial [Coriobacteriia bacterium]